MHQKKDPCNTCLVKACCSKPCDEKYEYISDCIANLTKFYDKYEIYKEGAPKEDIFLSDEVLTEKRRLENICIKNNKDIIDTSIRRGIK